MFQNILLLLVQIREVTARQILHVAHVVDGVRAGRETVVVVCQPLGEVRVVRSARLLPRRVQPLDVAGVGVEVKLDILVLRQVVKPTDRGRRIR